MGGSLYETKEGGRFVNGRLYGNGRILFESGDVYEGEFKDGRRSGQGKMEYKNIAGTAGIPETAVYEGAWKRNMREGQGEMTWSDGSSFSGEWRMD